MTTIETKTIRFFDRYNINEHTTPITFKTNSHHHSSNTKKKLDNSHKPEILRYHDICRMVHSLQPISTDISRKTNDNDLNVCLRTYWLLWKFTTAKVNFQLHFFFLTAHIIRVKLISTWPPLTN